MLRALLVGLTLLHLGPGLAFALLAFGCGAAAPWLGAHCDGEPVGRFGRLTLAAWAVLGAVRLAWAAVQRARRAPQAAGARAWALAAALAAGVGLGAVGAWLTGAAAAWLAVPLALTMAWLALADPLACVTARGTAPPGRREPRRHP